MSVILEVEHETAVLIQIAFKSKITKN